MYAILVDFKCYHLLVIREIDKILVDKVSFIKKRDGLYVTGSHQDLTHIYEAITELSASKCAQKNVDSVLVFKIDTLSDFTDIVINKEELPASPIYYTCPICETDSLSLEEETSRVKTYYCSKCDNYIYKTP